ncbi:MAG TPA: hypothetical protein DER58_09870, partial [Firmicutes bacterium]|nr:hypothetical protein [Bacillota bacterium]
MVKDLLFGNFALDISFLAEYNVIKAKASKLLIGSGTCPEEAGKVRNRWHDTRKSRQRSPSRLRVRLPGSLFLFIWNSIWRAVKRAFLFAFLEKRCLIGKTFIYRKHHAIMEPVLQEYNHYGNGTKT